MCMNGLSFEKRTIHLVFTYSRVQCQRLLYFVARNFRDDRYSGMDGDLINNRRMFNVGIDDLAEKPYVNGFVANVLHDDIGTRHSHF